MKSACEPAIILVVCCRPLSAWRSACQQSDTVLLPDFQFLSEGQSMRRRFSSVSFAIKLLVLIPWVSSFVVQPANRHSTAAIATLLHAKGRKGSNSSPKKIQVKLVKQVPGTGQVGDILKVTPAFYNNRLLPTQSAQIISDEQVAKERSDAEKASAELVAKARSMKEKVEGIQLTISRRAGPNGQLFGGVGAKTLMEELRIALEDDFLKAKHVKVASLLDEDGKKVRGDLKHVGDFRATVKLTSDCSASLKFTIEAADP